MTWQIARARNSSNPMKPREPHFAPKAKRCIMFFLEGAPSQIDLFDPKPKLNELDGQKLPDEMLKNVRFAFIQKDTAKLREKFAQAGYEGERLRELLSPVESLRIAHRLDPAHTWMYIAQDDEVVPIKNARLLATTAKLERSHQLEFPGGHYSVALYFPFIVDHVAQQMLPQQVESGQQ